MSETESELKHLLEAIYLRYHYDFRQYSQTALRRCLAPALSRFNCRTIPELQTRLLQDPLLLAPLLDQLTVPVSEMFRDPPFFRALVQQVIPVLQSYPSIKVWVAGCSTGEEAYSVAILLREWGILERTVIYATDINPIGLQVAEKGIYDLERMGQFSRNYDQAGGRHSLADYCTSGYGSAILDRTLAQHILFCEHDLATDSVFAEVQLVLCRNVLIYFEKELKERAIGLFKDSLARQGFLGLGSKENLRFSDHTPCFHDFVADQKIYRRRHD